jgi:hypothetical protein
VPPPPLADENPFSDEYFSFRTNHRQFTLSYRVLPPKRRKAAQNAPLSGGLKARDDGKRARNGFASDHAYAATDQKHYG